MKIKVQYQNEPGDEYRTTYYTEVDGKQFVLAPLALGGERTEQEVLSTARKLFGENVEVEW